ncbi:MAG: BON domain-containing protein, partial [Solirubrobacterales bacterium]|nr:BON domain-containing protein [Solirubrobacterales bacterium]
MLDNPPLREAVIASLASDPRIPDPDVIAVSAQGDVVTLRGAVETLRERHAAIDDARQVDGVREIDDELEFELG